jgi:hypothetical protein
MSFVRLNISCARETIEIVGAGLATQSDDLTANLSTKPALPQGGSTFNIALRAGQWAIGNSEEKRLPYKGLSDFIAI